MDVDITKDTKAFECIRCAECVKVCPTKAISASWGIIEKSTKQNSITNGGTENENV